VIPGSDGTVSVLAGGQLPLVLGDQSYPLTADPSAAPGAQISSSAGGNSPDFYSGTLGALLQTRNSTLGSLLGSGSNPGTLNTLAAGFASRVNSLLASGVTATGAAGVPIFSFDTTNPANAARTLSLNPAVTGDQLGLASTGASAASNGVANQLAALSSSTAPADQIGGVSAEAYFSNVAASFGGQLSSAQNSLTAGQSALTSAQTNRQQQIGVSLNQEAATISEFERSYQANAQVVSIINQLAGDTVNLINNGGAAL
jgi:flagellar hook-associated protein 1 FlgK